MNTVAQFAQSLKRSVGLVVAAGRGLVALVVVLTVAAALLVAAELLLIRSVVDDLTAGGAAVLGLILFGIVGSLRRLLGVALHELTWLVSERVDQVIMRDVLEIATEASYEDFEQASFQDQLARATIAAKREVWAASDGVLRTFRSGATIFTLGVVLLAIAPRLAWPFALAGMALGFVAFLKGQLSYEFAYHETAADRERRYLRDALVSRSEGREIRLFGTSKLLRDRHEALVVTRIEKLRRLLGKRLGAEAASTVALSAILVGCLVYIGSLVERNATELGSAAVAALTAYQLIGALSGLFNGTSTLLEATRHVDDLHAFLERPAPTPELPDDSPADSLKLVQVSYRYPGATRDAIGDVDLTLRRGEILAVVGENGSGKSTLAKLLLGLYQPTSGTVVRVDADGTEHDVTSPLVGCATATFQDFARYELSVVENLTLGIPNAGEGQPDQAILGQALAAVDLDTAISQLPNDVRTRLGRRFANGQDLSVGQWQRLALARAMMNQRASFVVLDEPTSALDPMMEQAMFDNVRANFPGRGVLLISHRLSSLHQADRIVVLQDGEIIEQGTHSELVVASGLYAAMHRRQAERFK